GAHANDEVNPIVNTATADGDDFDGDPLDAVDATHTTTILHYTGTLSIIKEGPATVYHGDTVTYYVYVSYTSLDNSPARNVVVTDDQYTLLFDATSDDGDGLLEVGEIWVYYAEVTIGAHANDEVNPIVNTATADGDDFDGDPLDAVDATHTTTI
ncbi:MAG: hypothetical protein ACXAAR_05795, partial [Candidatus Thorarchaeota archaeon]